MSHFNSGVTLIELMIAIALVSILALVAVPLTVSWSNQAKLTETAGILDQAFGRAKASALRNPAGVAGTAASALCFAGDRVSLRLAEDAGTPADCGAANTPSWSAALPGGITLSPAGTTNPLSCVCLSNKSLLLSGGADCGGGCADTLTLTATVGGENDTLNLR